MSEAPNYVAPAQTPEGVLFQELAGALVATLGAKRGRRLLDRLTSGLANRLTFAEAVPLHGNREAYATRRDATRDAVALYRAALPTLLASIPRE